MNDSWLLLWLEAGAAAEALWAHVQTRLFRGRPPAVSLSAQGGRLVWFGESHHSEEGVSFSAACGHPRLGRSLLDSSECAAQWRQSGALALRALSGNWALLYYDRRSEALVAACDMLAAEPVFWRRLPGGWALSSRAVWLAGLPPPAADDLDSWHDFLLWGLRDQTEHTFWEGVRSLPPAALWRFDLRASQPQVAAWYVPPPPWEGPAFRSVDVEAAATALRAVLTPAIADGLAGAGRAAAFVSGGLDSATLAALAAKGGFSCRALSTHWPGQPFDEFRFAQMTADHVGWPLSAVQAADADFLEALPHLLSLHEGPFLSPGTFAQFALMRRAAALEAEVVLDGTGADALLAGHYLHLLRWGGLALARGQVGVWVQVAKAMGGLGRFLSAWGRFVVKTHLRRRADRKAAVAVLRRLYEEWTLFEPDFLATHGRAWARQVPPLSWGLNAVLHREYFGGEVTFLLRSLHRNARAWGLRVHAPFAHERSVAEQMLGLPASAKVHGGWTKWILRRAMSPFLPAPVVWRRDKQAQATPANRWTRLLVAHYWQGLEADPLGIFRPQALRRLKRAFFQPRGAVERYRAFKFAAAAAWWQMRQQ